MATSSCVGKAAWAGRTASCPVIGVTTSGGLVARVRGPKRRSWPSVELVGEIGAIEVLCVVRVLARGVLGEVLPDAVRGVPRGGSLGGVVGVHRVLERLVAHPPSLA